MAMYLLPAEPPRTVALAFDPNTVDPATRCQALAVEIRDARTRETIAAFGLRDAAAWLDGHGYRYHAGTNGIWVRA